MKPTRILFLALLASFIAASCSKEIEIDIPDSAEQIVVEGSIETGTPPMVILTRSKKFFSTFDLNDLSGYFVHDAVIKVWSDAANDSVQLVEFCLNDLPLTPEQQAQVLQLFGYNLGDSAIPNVCMYTVPDIFNYYLTGQTAYITGEERTTYFLQIQAEGKTLTSSTYIPTRIPPNSMSLQPHPNPERADTFVAVYADVSVPDTFGNFVRYWTKRNEEPFYAPLSQSVWDDRLFVGLSISLPLERGRPSNHDYDFATYTYFEKGDTVTLKWGNIAYPTYDFFFTLENDGGGSPFSAPIKIKSNVTGGLGIWAGYATSYTQIVIPQ